MHGFLVSLFSSLIGPFGGFLASGLKRACRQKVSETKAIETGIFLPADAIVEKRSLINYQTASAILLHQLKLVDFSWTVGRI